jgi:hypothetical protein
MPKERGERKAPQALCTCAIGGCSASRLFRHKARRAGKAHCLHQRRNTGAGQPGVALRVGWCAPMAALRRLPRAQAIAFAPRLALNAHQPTAVANDTGAECYALSLRANLESTPRHGAPQTLALLAKPARAASCRPTPRRGARSRQGHTGTGESKQNAPQTFEYLNQLVRNTSLRTRSVLTFGPPDRLPRERAPGRGWLTGMSAKQLLAWMANSCEPRSGVRSRGCPTGPSTALCTCAIHNCSASAVSPQGASRREGSLPSPAAQHRGGTAWRRPSGGLVCAQGGVAALAKGSGHCLRTAPCPEPTPAHCSREWHRCRVLWGCVSFAGFFAHSKKPARARHLDRSEPQTSNRVRNRPSRPTSTPLSLTQNQNHKR